MKLAPETVLAGWAVGTGWLLVYVLTHYGHHQMGAELSSMQWIRAAGVVLGLLLFPLLRKWFRVWLTRTRGP